MNMPFNSMWPDAIVIDLRDEFSNLLNGDSYNPGIGRGILLRRLTDRHCVCWDGLTGSPDPSCSYCEGEGWYYTEGMIKMFMSKNFGSVQNASNVIMLQKVLGEYGFTDENRALGFTEYWVYEDYATYASPTKKYDSLYELLVDDQGNLVYPIKRLAKWQVKSVTPHQGDYGRIEFVELGLNKANV